MFDETTDQTTDQEVKVPEYITEGVQTLVDLVLNNSTADEDQRVCFPKCSDALSYLTIFAITGVTKAIDPALKIFKKKLGQQRNDGTFDIILALFAVSYSLRDFGAGNKVAREYLGDIKDQKFKDIVLLHIVRSSLRKDNLTDAIFFAGQIQNRSEGCQAYRAITGYAVEKYASKFFGILILKFLK